MATTLIAGTVYRQNQPTSLSASVEKIDFEVVVPTTTPVPAGIRGTLYLKNTPPQIGHYDKGDILKYTGDRGSRATMQVLQNVGPTKYTIQTQ